MGKGDENPVANKYFYVTHAELNAILNARQSVEDSTVYVTLFPCNECAKAIIQSGIKEVIYYDIPKNKSKESLDKFEATCKMFDDAGVVYKQYEKSNRLMQIIL